MENDKKKRKNNKKKKNKQQQQQVKAGEDASLNAGETSSQDQNHVEERINSNQASGIVNDGLDDWSNRDVDDNSSRSDSSTVLADIEKQKWLREETKLKEMVKQLLYEKDSYIHSQADLGSRIKQLQCENDSLHQKEVSLEQRISHLTQEKANVSLEEVNLREKVRHIEKEKFVLVENENSSKEQIATLSNENTTLRMQVLNLERVQNSLSQENKQLLDNASTLKSRIQDLERSLTSAISPAGEHKDVSEKEDLNAQVEAAFELVERLVTENAELVEKLNELYMELERHRVVPEATSLEVSDDVGVSDLVPGSSEELSTLSRSAKRFDTMQTGDERVVSDDLDLNYANVVEHSSETNVSGEIVQIPLLDANEAQDLEAQASPGEKDDEPVPITDAPLIGAPFRLISFVAKYVSGADLVNNEH